VVFFWIFVVLPKRQTFLFLGLFSELAKTPCLQVFVGFGSLSPAVSFRKRAPFLTSFAFASGAFATGLYEACVLMAFSALEAKAARVILLWVMFLALLN